MRYRLALAGIDWRSLRRTVATYPAYCRSRRLFATAMKDATDPLPLGMDCWCLHDRQASAGSIRTHYFHQDLLVARRIRSLAPHRHIDIGSRVDGFVAHVASFREIEVIDIRPPEDQIPGITFLQADLMQALPVAMRGCTDSLSCLHALEHFGLGRYGDPIDPDGHLRGLENLRMMLSPGGRLHLSLPMGPSRVEFNAHRVFSLPHILKLLSEAFRVERFSYVDDLGCLHDDQSFNGSEAEASYECRFGCAIIEAVALS